MVEDSSVSVKIVVILDIVYRGLRKLKTQNMSYAHNSNHNQCKIGI